MKHERDVCADPVISSAMRMAAFGARLDVELSTRLKGIADISTGADVRRPKSDKGV